MAGPTFRGHFDHNISRAGSTVRFLPDQRRLPRSSLRCVQIYCTLNWRSMSDPKTPYRVRRARTMNVPATPARPSAISPIGKKSVLAPRDDPPAPVSGAPWGSTNFGDVVGTNVVIGERTVVVVADPGADDPPVEDDGAVVVVPAVGVSVVVVAVDVSVVVVVGVPDDKVVVVAAGGMRHVDVVIV